jgi:tRNA(His) 5'-end guanylyltransferase
MEDLEKMEDSKEMSLKEKFYAYQKKANHFLDPDKYIFIHVDGRSFSHKVKNKFNKPFDDDVIDAMDKTAMYLCKDIQGACFAYVQSDEISIVVKKETPTSQVFFNGRMSKMQSIIASDAGTEFSRIMAAKRIKDIPTCASSDDVKQMCLDVVENGPTYQFDCKVFNVDSANDAVACILYRNIDCIRNSKQQVCQTYLPHSLLVKKNTDEQVSLLKQNKGIDWEKFDDNKKYGRLIKKISVKHYDNNGNFDYERSKWESFPFFDMTDTEKRESFIEEFELKD